MSTQPPTSQGRHARVAATLLATTVAATGLTSWGLATTAAAQSTPAVVAAPAAGTTFKACVNKRTGEMRMLLSKKAKKRKCAKGWRKISWSSAAQPGSPGAPGAGGATGDRGALGALEVYDSTGSRIGSLLGGLSFMSPYPLYSVATDSGTYTYTDSGIVTPNFTPYYLNNTCTGTTYTSVSDSELSNVLAQAGTSARMVTRNSEPTLGPVKAYTIAGSSTPVVAVNAWRLNTTGVCTDASPLTTNLVTLDVVTPAPTDRPGPLSLR